MQGQVETVSLEGRLEKGILVYKNMLRRGFSAADAQSIAELTDEEAAIAEAED